MRLELITLANIMEATTHGGKINVAQLVSDIVDSDVKVQCVVVRQDYNFGRNGYKDIDIKDLTSHIDLPYIVASNYDDSTCLTYGLFEYDDDTYTQFHVQPDGCVFPNMGPKVFLHFLDYHARLNSGLNRDPFAD